MNRGGDEPQPTNVTKQNDSILNNIQLIFEVCKKKKINE